MSNNTFLENFYNEYDEDDDLKTAVSARWNILPHADI